MSSDNLTGEYMSSPSPQRRSHYQSKQDENIVLMQDSRQQNIEILEVNQPIGSPTLNNGGHKLNLPQSIHEKTQASNTRIRSFNITSKK